MHGSRELRERGQVCVCWGGGDVGSGGGVGFREIKGASLDGGHFCKLR